MNDEEIFQALREELESKQEDWPGGLTPEAELVGQSVDPEEATELEWHIMDPHRGIKPDSECDLGSCRSLPTYYVELLSGRLFFGCEEHVDELIGMKVAKKKKKFEKGIARLSPHKS